MSVRILHAADLHLDSPFEALSGAQAAQRRREQRDLLRALPELATAHGAEIILLAGDLLDSGSPYPETAKALAETFAGCASEVFLAPGNHDYYSAGAPYARLTFPENVHIFRSPRIEAVALPELGVRMMTLTWNYPNELAAPNANPGGPLVANTETGLTERGFAFLEEMEKLHITADVSHLSDKGFWDIANHSTRPFAASHSNCRALSPHNRNLTDEMIRALAEKGGIAGLNYCASFVDADSAHPKLCRSTVERLAKHAAHFKQVGGIEVISLGSDFDGIGGQHELETAADMPLLAEALRREGFTEDEVEAIYWRNAYRFFKNNL